MVIRSSSKNKRKGDDSGLVSAFNRSVVFSPRNNNNNNTSSMIQDDAWIETKSRLNSILELCQSDNRSGDSDDDLLNDVAATKTLRDRTFPANLQNALEKATILQSKLEAQIGQVNLHLQDESAAAAALEEQMKKIVEDNKLLERQSQESVTHSQQLQNEIDEYNRIIQEQENTKELVEAQRKIQVPRLQQQISLYATITRIKWDFELQEKLQQDQMVDTHLVGQVSIPSTNMVQRFEIDRQEHSRFDIANRLWSLMEGGGEGVGSSDSILEGVYEGQNVV